MKVTVANIKGLNKDLKVLIDKETMNSYMDEKYEEIKGTVNLKGFRPGKVPREVLKRQFGKAIFGEVLDKVLKETSTKALEENKIKPAGQPKLDLKTYGEDKELEYVLSITELPKVDIKSLESIKFDQYSVKIDDSETDKRIKEIAPLINISPNCRYPILGASWQPRGGTARHDAVAWGYARAADALGVDMIQQTEVIGIRRKDGAVVGVETSKGFIGARKVACVTAGSSGLVAGMAGLRLPVESRPLQALVSEPVKPCLDTVVMSNAVHGYVSQSDKGDLVIGAGVDSYNGYGQRGSFNIIEHTVQAICELFPAFSRIQMNRQWGGIVDTCPDACPIISKTSVDGLYFNCGWGTGGFKATPGSGDLFAHTIANDEPHELNAAFNINRFVSGDLVDEHGAAAVAH